MFVSGREREREEGVCVFVERETERERVARGMWLVTRLSNLMVYKRRRRPSLTCTGEEEELLDSSSCLAPWVVVGTAAVAKHMHVPSV